MERKTEFKNEKYIRQTQGRAKRRRKVSIRQSEKWSDLDNHSYLVKLTGRRKH